MIKVTVVLPVEPEVTVTMPREIALSIIAIDGHISGDAPAREHFNELATALCNALKLTSRERSDLWARFGGNLRAIA